jgi:hypothetical protein
MCSHIDIKTFYYDNRVDYPLLLSLCRLTPGALKTVTLRQRMGGLEDVDAGFTGM